MPASTDRSPTKPPRAPAVLAAALLLAAPVGNLKGAPADRFADVVVTAQPVAGSVFMLTGAGGNVGASVGEDGTLVIDDQYAPLAGRIQAVLNDLGGERPKLVLNTHFHGDHTGGNAHFGKAGTIIAHHNVRARLLSGEDVPPGALPLVTYSDRIRIHFNQEEIQVIHLPDGHTDGDSVVWFTTANVLHTGDLLFVGRFPYIDLDSGGSVAGFVRNLEALLTLVPDDVKVIPGHGPLTGKEAIRESLEMIRATRKIVARRLEEGRPAEDIVAEGLPEAFASFGTGFISEARWIRILLADAG